MRSSIGTIAVTLALRGGITDAQSASQPGSPDTTAAEHQPDAVFEHFTKPLDNDTQRIVRVLTLANVMERNCKGARMSRSAVDRFVAQSHIEKTPSDEIDLATAVVTPDFSYFDHEKLSRLCARIDDLFGARGVLAPGLVSHGEGVPRLPFDPRNPYLPVQMLPKRNSP